MFPKFDNVLGARYHYREIPVAVGCRKEVMRWQIDEPAGACPMSRARAGRNRVPETKTAPGAGSGPMLGNRVPSSVTGCSTLGVGQPTLSS